MTSRHLLVRAPSFRNEKPRLILDLKMQYYCVAPDGAYHGVSFKNPSVETLNRSISLADKPLLKSRFRHADERVFFGRARLYRDRIVLSGWTWTGRYRRIIWLEKVVGLRWWSGAEHPYNIVFYLHDGAPLWVRLSGGGLWKYRVEECLGRQAEARAALPRVLPEATAA